jgi:hypothetical protein
MNESNSLQISNSKIHSNSLTKEIGFWKLNQEAHNLCGYTVSDQFDLKNRDVVAIKNWRKTLDDICIQNANDSNVLLVKLIMTKIDKGLEAL